MIRVETAHLNVSLVYAKVYVAKYCGICHSDNYCNDYDSCTIGKCDKNIAQLGYPADSGTCTCESLKYIISNYHKWLSREYNLKYYKC